MAKVELRSWRGVTGEVTLADGRAVPSNEQARRLLDGLTVVEPGTLEVVTPADGERYLRALPTAVSGSYLGAVLVEA